jgi:putative endopeptidase
MKYLLTFLFAASLLTTAQTKQTLPIDPANIDRTVDPCDDFYRFANGNWLKNNPIPAEFSMWGSFNELNEKNSLVLKQILESAAADKKAKNGSNRQKIGDMYAMGMDSASIEKLGASPIAGDLKRIDAISDAAGVKNEIAYLHTIGVRVLFGFFATQDEKDSKSVIGQLSQGGLGLPDRDYYIAADEKSKKIREEYELYVANMLTLAGDDAAVAKTHAALVMALETQLAKASFTRVERRDAEKNYNKRTLAELEQMTPNFSWKEYFSARNAPNIPVVNVGQPPFFAEVNAMFAAVPVAEWKEYLRWKVIASAAPSLSSAFVAEHFRFTGKVLTGAKEMQPRWKRILGVINGTMGEALGELYVAKTFTPEAKKKAGAMVDNLIAAFREHINTKLDWMDDSTRTAALHKLSSFTVKIGYTDKWEDYSSLKIDRKSYLENIRRANAFSQQQDLATIGKPVDRTKWGMTPQTVNAYYNSNLNEIVFPAAILQPPFYDPNADDAVNYGGMGSVIGHELTHGFDDEGSKYDAEGNLKEWWTTGTRKRFEERVAVLEEQFNSFVAIDSMHVNGKLTSGENIADLGGLSIAYTALQHVLDKKPNLQMIDGLTPAQRFFLSWAQVWRRNYRDEALRLQVRTDPHSPGMFRTNGPISNMQEFFDAFGCKDGTLVRPVAERAKIW